MNKCDPPFYCEDLKRGHIFWCHTFWGGELVGWCGCWGCLGWRGCFDVFDKGSHFLVSHFLEWELGLSGGADGGRVCVGVGW